MSRPGSDNQRDSRRLNAGMVAHGSRSRVAVGLTSFRSSLHLSCLFAGTRGSSGAIPNAGKVMARPGNLTARGGKNAF